MMFNGTVTGLTLVSFGLMVSLSLAITTELWELIRRSAPVSSRRGQTSHRLSLLLSPSTPLLEWSLPRQSLLSEVSTPVTCGWP